LVIYFFYGQGCPHCALIEEFFEKEGLYKNYPIERKEIYFNRENALLFSNVMEQRGVSENERGVPTVVIGSKILVGDQVIITRFRKEADAFLKTGGIEHPPTQTQDVIEHTRKSDLTLPVVLAASIVDAINPCAFAVLIILMTTILVNGNANKALKAGFAFSFSVFISYFLMGLGVYKALGMGILTPWFMVVIGWLAILLGFLNLKDYFWYGKGFLMEVPISWRPQLKRILSSVTNPIGAFGIGFLVSLFLLPCTSGPYIVILGMLATKEALPKALSYLIIYNLIFVLPMVLITLAVYKGFDPNKAEKIRQKQLRLIHLIAGIILIGMGIVLLTGVIS